MTLTTIYLLGLLYHFVDNLVITLIEHNYGRTILALIFSIFMALLWPFIVIWDFLTALHNLTVKQ